VVQVVGPSAPVVPIAPVPVAPLAKSWVLELPDAVANSHLFQSPDGQLRITDNVELGEDNIAARLVGFARTKQLTSRPFRSFSQFDRIGGPRLVQEESDGTRIVATTSSEGYEHGGRFVSEGLRGLLFAEKDGKPLWTKPFFGGESVIHDAMTTSTRDVFITASFGYHTIIDNSVYRVPYMGGLVMLVEPTSGAMRWIKPLKPGETPHRSAANADATIAWVHTIKRAGRRNGQAVFREQLRRFQTASGEELPAIDFGEERIASFRVEDDGSVRVLRTAKEGAEWVLTQQKYSESGEPGAPQELLRAAVLGEPKFVGERIMVRLGSAEQAGAICKTPLQLTDETAQVHCFIEAEGDTWSVGYMGHLDKAWPQGEALVVLLQRTGAAGRVLARLHPDHLQALATVRKAPEATILSRLASSGTCGGTGWKLHSSIADGHWKRSCVREATGSEIAISDPIKALPPEWTSFACPQGTTAKSSHRSKSCVGSDGKPVRQIVKHQNNQIASTTEVRDGHKVFIAYTAAGEIKVQQNTDLRDAAHPLITGEVHEYGKLSRRWWVVDGVQHKETYVDGRVYQQEIGNSYRTLFPNGKIMREQTLLPKALGPKESWYTDSQRFELCEVRDSTRHCTQWLPNGTVLGTTRERYGKKIQRATGKPVFIGSPPPGAGG
tara:strand:+ start:114476 stop:116470 length:1995 start_codon:yes stop_codon:yes gene_type:complete